MIFETQVVLRSVHKCEKRIIDIKNKIWKEEDVSVPTAPTTSTVDTPATSTIPTTPTTAIIPTTPLSAVVPPQLSTEDKTKEEEVNKKNESETKDEDTTPLKDKTKEEEVNKKNESETKDKDVTPLDPDSPKARGILYDQNQQKLEKEKKEQIQAAIKIQASSRGRATRKAEKKQEILNKLEKMRRLGVQGIKHFNMSSDVNEMEEELSRIVHR